MTTIKSVLAWLIDYFERGDLVPAIVLISAWHYTAILRLYDAWPVAVAIGMLIDLGHYRWVRAAVRYQGAGLRERLLRWALAALMTAVSVVYQQRYYGDWWLSTPLPILIASLAWLSHIDRAQPARKPAEHAPLPAVDVREVHAELPEPAHSVWHCADCERIFATQQGLAAHKRHCKVKVG